MEREFRACKEELEQALAFMNAGWDEIGVSGWNDEFMAIARVSTPLGKRTLSLLLRNKHLKAYIGVVCTYTDSDINVSDVDFGETGVITPAHAVKLVMAEVVKRASEGI